MSQNEKTSKNTTLVEHFQNTIGISRKDAKSQLIAYKDTTPHFPWLVQALQYIFQSNLKDLEISKILPGVCKFSTEKELFHMVSLMQSNTI